MGAKKRGKKPALRRPEENQEGIHIRTVLGLMDESTAVPKTRQSTKDEEPRGIIGTP